MMDMNTDTETEIINKEECINAVDMNNYHSSWSSLFNNISYEKLKENIDIFYETRVIYPPKECIFRIFEMNVEDIKVVLLGQDPYHSHGQAHGFSFSVPNGIKIPPSLRNIFKELKLEFPERNYHFTSGNLERWFYEEKIFLLNSSLTVIEGKPGSHMKYWKNFTDDIIHYISQKNKKCVFLLLGNYAKTKDIFIENKDNIVYAPHPSPLARGFIGSGVFHKVEKILKEPLNWNNQTI